MTFLTNYFRKFLSNLPNIKFAQNYGFLNVKVIGGPIIFWGKFRCLTCSFTVNAHEFSAFYRFSKSISVLQIWFVKVRVFWPRFRYSLSFLLKNHAQNEHKMIIVLPIFGNIACFVVFSRITEWVRQDCDIKIRKKWRVSIFWPILCRFYAGKYREIPLFSQKNAISQKHVSWK